MRAVKGSLGHSPKVRWRELEGPRLGEERVSARSGGRVRMGRAVEPNPTISHQSEDHPGEKKEGGGIEEVSGRRYSWFNSVSCGLCGAGTDVAVECEVPAAGAGGGET